MTDTAPRPAAVPQPLWEAAHSLGLPKKHLKDLESFPEEAGEILLDAVDALRERTPEAARTLAEALRDHAPHPGHRQFATHQLAGLFRAEGRDEDAERLLVELMGPGLDRGVALLLAEDLAERGEYEKALHCYNIVCRGMLAEPPETVAELNRLGLMPLMGRARMRELLGMTPDGHDLAARSTDAYLPKAESLADLENGAGPSRPFPGDAGGRQDLREETPPAPRTPGRNEPCSCGSERKFKKCCGSPLAR